MNKARKARRDHAYLAWVRAQPCLLLGIEDRMYTRPPGECWGAIEAHHAGVKPGVGLKADDRTAIPLCHRHHRELEDKSGWFEGWTKAAMREYEDARISEVQNAWEDEQARGWQPGPVARLLASDLTADQRTKVTEWAQAGIIPVQDEPEDRLRDLINDAIDLIREGPCQCRERTETSEPIECGKHSWLKRAAKEVA